MLSGLRVAISRPVTENVRSTSTAATAPMKFVVGLPRR